MKVFIYYIIMSFTIFYCVQTYAMEQSPQITTSFFSSLKTINNSFKGIFKRDFDLNLNIPLMFVLLLAFDWYNNDGQVRRKGSLDLFCTYILLDLGTGFLLDP